MNLFRKKLPGLEDAPRLRRSLNVLDLTFLGLGGMIGAGIFVLTGVVAATQAGPGVAVSYLLAGTASGFVALAYAELAARIGGCGGAYGYAYAVFGEFVAWIVGWNLVFGICLTVPAVANGWSAYLAGGLESIGIELLPSLTRGPAAGGLINLPAAAIILVLMLALFAGVKQSARLNNLIVLVKLLALGLFVLIAYLHFRPDFLRPRFPFGWFGITPEGMPIGVLAGAAVVFFAYTGFQAIAVAVEEARNPRLDVPIGIVASLTVCTGLYVAVAGFLTATVPYSSLNDSSPLEFALLQMGVFWGSGLVAIGVIGGLTSTMLVTYYALTRALFAIARDRLLPPILTRLSRTQVPVGATMLSGIAMALLAGFVPLGELAQFANAAILAEFLFVCCAVIVLRFTTPDEGIMNMHMPRQFRIPGGIVIPVLGAIMCLALIAFLPPATVLGFVLWLVTGMAAYFVLAVPFRRDRSA